MSIQATEAETESSPVAIDVVISEIDVTDALRDYEAQFPEETFQSISCAITGVEETTIVEVLEVIAQSRGMGMGGEKAARATEWESLLTALLGLESTSLSMRQYEEGEAPSVVNDEAAERGDAYSLAAHSASICARGTGRIYELPSGKKAVVWNREPSYGTFSVKCGDWKGTLHVAICEDVDEWFESEMYGDNWRRPQDL